MKTNQNVYEFTEAFNMFITNMVNTQRIAIENPKI